MTNNLTKTADLLDRIVGGIGVFFSWASVVLIGAIVVQVILRYVFRSGLVKLEELQWHLYGVIIMVGLSYAHVHKAHVRVDLLHHKFSPKVQAAVEIGGMFLLLMPFVYVVLVHGYEFVLDSLMRGERSAAPDGLPMRWGIKLFVPFGFLLILLSSVASLLRDITILRGTNEHQ